MEIVYAEDKKSFVEAIETIRAGECVRIDSISSVSDSAKYFLDAAVKLADKGGELVCESEGFDTRREQGALLFPLCRALSELEQAGRKARRHSGIERAKSEGKYKGRKPIAVNGELFESVVARWRGGELNARQAMALLELKPNTFYRRIKEQEEQKMKDYKQMEHEIKSEIKDAVRQSRHDLGELKKQVRAEAKEVKKAADEKLELHDVEREMRKDRIRAEVEHHDAVRQMRKDVEAEARELKKMMENE